MIFPFNRRRRTGPITLGDRARDAGQWEEAARYYRAALAHNPENAPIWIQFGHAIKEAGQFLEAEQAYRQALAYDPNGADGHLQLGHVLKLQERIEEAEAAYLHALTLDPWLPYPLAELRGLGWSDAEITELQQRFSVDRPLPVEEHCNASVPGDEGSLMLVVDSPQYAGDRVSDAVRGGLYIEGWALAREGVAAIDVWIDEKHYGTAKYGLRREDVGTNWPDWVNARLSGYALPIAATALETGEHLVRVELRTNTGRRESIGFTVFADQVPDENKPWALRRKMARSEIDVAENILAGIGWRPLFGLLLEADAQNDREMLAETLQSLRGQAYTRWHLVITCESGAAQEELKSWFAYHAPDLTPCVAILVEPNLGCLIEAVAGAVDGHAPDLIGLLSAGDILSCDCLLRIAASSGLHGKAELFYADERRLSPITGNVEAFLKPQWSPDLLLATNYIGRFWCARTDLLDRVDSVLEDWRRYGEYDLLLRLTELTQAIQHVPRVLCERAAGHLDDPLRERGALSRALARRGIDAEIGEGCAPGYYRVIRRPRDRGLVSIIIPTCAARELIKPCIESIRRRTSYRNFEIICVENIPQSACHWKQWLAEAADKVIHTTQPYNWSYFNNLGAAQSSGNFLLFLNDDVEVIDDDWLDALVQHADRPEVGVVGARLVYPDGKIQHAGMFWAGVSGRHAFRFAPRSDPGYFGLAATTRNVLAVTGACLMVQRTWFNAIGGFDERHGIVNNDVDLCLRCRSAGRAVVYEPRATLIHHELASRHDMADSYDAIAFTEKWEQVLAAGDPYYHPYLSLDRDDYSADQEPVQLVYAGRPLFRRADIGRILVLKLDHLGDFVTGVPALRRLHDHFPNAELYLLASAGCGALARAFVPEIKEIINFEFFHTRSALGERTVLEDDLIQLERVLAPFRFDLAIDLRKYLDTRHVLRFTGARWLAGYDRDGRFPWLDIALEWEGDARNGKKRSHISDDFCRLVEAVALSSVRERRILSPPGQSGCPRELHFAGEGGKPLVCIHPGVGTETRQWPAEHFASLIDLLASRADIDVALIGSSDEAEIAGEVIEKVKHKNVVRSFVGLIALMDLPDFLASSALFIGNNSGPKHIAAGLGIPTIGIHSGVVDSREWGPIGPNAVAIRRDMNCSPCYLAKAEQCPRQLACLTSLRPHAVYEICMEMLKMPTSPKAPIEVPASAIIGAE